MAGASAALGLAAHFVSSAPAAPIAAGVVGMAIGASIGYGKPSWRVPAAIAASVPLVLMAPSAPMLAAVAAVMGLAIAGLGLRGMRGVAAIALGMLTMLLAVWAAHRVGVAKQTLSWPSWARDVTASAAMGMIGVIAMLPRHLRVALDPVQASVRRMPAEMDSEVRELCNRSLAIWTGARERLADDDPGMKLVRDGVLKTLEVAAKCTDVVPAGATDAELAKRVEDLDARIAAASDAEVKTQYQSARGALDDQRRYRERIKQNRERLIARMHNHVAALEKFQLAASGLVAARAATAGATAVKQLEELSHDVAASGEALAELELGAAPAAETVAEATPAAPADVARA